MSPYGEHRPTNPSEKGSGHVLDDLDLAILSALPDEGEKIGKYQPRTSATPDIRKALEDNTLTPNKIGARLGLMKKDGLVLEPVRNKWQRTAAGRKIAAETGPDVGAT